MHLHRNCYTARKYHRASRSSKPCATRARILSPSHPGRSMIGAMAVPVAHKRKRGNPNWGLPIPPAPPLPTEFELLVGQLQLTTWTYTSSAELHTWCEQNRNRCYIP